MVDNKFFDGEDARLQELLKYCILDTPQEQDFEDVVKLVSFVCNASIGLVTFVDECRQWFKAKIGWEQFETSREISFCTHTILGDGILQVQDTLLDDRFSNNPLVVAGPKIRFYAGVPLITPNGYKLGTLCVLDQQPRTLTEKQLFALEVLGKYVVKLLELRLKKQNLEESYKLHEDLQQEMNRQQHALARAQNVASIGIFELDIKSMRLKASEGLANLFGLGEAQDYDVDEIYSLVHDEDLPSFLEYLQNLLDSSEMRLSYEYRCRKKSTGQEVYIRATGEIVRNIKGEPFKLIGIKQDITEQKGYEQQLEGQNAELLKVNQELDNFVYRVSHDLRAPISSLLGLVEIITAEDDIAKVKELLLLVKKTLDKQDRFIKDILDYSRNARQGLEPEEINFKELVEDTFLQFAYSNQSEKVEYFINVDQDVPFFTDSYRLRIILNNLISNAFKYHSAGKENSFVNVKVKVSKSDTVIVVEDNGIGIEQSHLDKVFNMFYRATDYHPGSGLGLYIVKETVLKLKGEVSIKSHRSEGTTVTVHLPNLAATN